MISPSAIDGSPRSLQTAETGPPARAHARSLSLSCTLSRSLSCVGLKAQQAEIRAREILAERRAAAAAEGATEAPGASLARLGSRFSAGVLQR